MRKVRFLVYTILGLVIFAGGGMCLINALMPLVLRKGNVVVVPDLKGQDITEAKARLEGLGLVYRTDTALPSRDFPEGTVMAQDPGPGSRVKKGRGVRITVSLGEKKVVVPDLAGEEGEHARAVLRKLGLCVKLSGQESTDMEAGYALGTRPRPGSQVAVGDTVILVVSTGLPRVIPDTVLLQIENMAPGDSAEPR